MTTQKGNKLYLHLFRPQPELTLELPGKVRSAVLLADGTPVSFKQKKGTVTLTIPEPTAATPDQVVTLEFR